MFSTDLSLIPFLTLGYGQTHPGREPSPHLDLPRRELHTNFKLNKEGEYLALVAPDGHAVIDSHAPAYPTQVTDLAYGRHVQAGLYYLDPPTPGASNSSSTAYPGISATAQFSHQAGTFAAPFDLVLSGADPSAIHYTLDGSLPSLTSPTYTGPIHISQTTWVRVRIYESGLAPGPVVSHAYLGLALDLLAFDSNLPLIVVDSFGFNIDRESSPYAPRPFRPVITACIEVGPSGRAALRDPSQHAGYGAMHVRGRSSALFFPKKQYAFETRDEADDDNDVALLGFPSESDWIFHGPYSDKTLMRNFAMYTWSNGIGRYAVRTRFVELFVDSNGGLVQSGDYRGVYVFMEKIKGDAHRVDIAELTPGDRTEPDITGGYILAKDWLEGAEGETYFVTETYGDALMYVEPDAEDITAEQRAWIASYMNEFEAVLASPGFADPLLGYRAYIDVGSFIDHHLMVELARNVDGFVLSTFLFKDRGGKIHMGPIWDFNLSLGNADYFDGWRPEGWHHENPAFPHTNPNCYKWYERLFEDVEYVLQYADRWYQLRRTHFSTTRLVGDIIANAAYLFEAQQRNFVRWPILGTYVWPNPPGWGDRVTYQDEIEYLRDWLTARLAWMDSQVDIDYAAYPPQYFLNGSPSDGGVIDPGDVLTMTDPHGVGTIYYTVDGADPRLPGGAVSGSAIPYTDPIILSGTTRVKARVLWGSSWGALNEASFVLRSEQVVINEINYNSAADFDPEDWIELHNAGDQVVDISGWRLCDEDDAHVFTFGAGTTLIPGDYLVVCADLAAFQEHFPGVPAVGNLGYGLGAGGDKVRLFDASDQLLDIVAYDDEWPWPDEPDGNGPTLELVHPTLDNSLPSSWLGSTAAHGTPDGQNSVYR
ncbi:MAG: CotH kinase family protein [Planctomycetota bacterium]